MEKVGFEHPLLKKVITNSNMVRNEILEYYSVDPNKIEILHNGVEWKEMEKDFIQGFEKKETLSKQLNLNSSHYQFLFIGNNYERKGLAILLKGLSLLKEKNFHLSVIGKEKNIRKFLRLKDKLGLEKNVSFFGPQSSISSFYQIADCLVIPSFL